MEKKEYIEAGRIINTHGVAGEVKIEVWLDSPRFFRSFKHLYLDGRELTVTGTKTLKSFVIAKLEGVDDINAAMALKGKTLCIRRSEAALPRGGFFLQDIIGAKVLDEGGTELGILEEILERPASNIYIVRGEREILIPAVPEFVLNTDAEAGVITVRLIEGM